MNFAVLFPAWQQWLSPYGRLCRKSYFASLVVYFALTFFFLLPIGLALRDWSFSTRHGSGSNVAMWLVSGLVMLALAYCIFCLHAKRLHDLGLPAAIALVFIIGMPVGLVAGIVSQVGAAPEWLDILEKGLNELARDANIGFGAYLLLAPGERGDNRYGEDPLYTPSDGWK